MNWFICFKNVSSFHCRYICVNRGIYLLSSLLLYVGLLLYEIKFTSPSFLQRGLLPLFSMVKSWWTARCMQECPMRLTSPCFTCNNNPRLPVALNLEQILSKFLAGFQASSQILKSKAL